MKIRSGGHDYEGVSYVSHIVPFFILDTFNFRKINVSIEESNAWVEVGANLGELYYRIVEQSNVHGFPVGVCATVGVGGHFSGGGYGNMMRKYGISVDNIIDAQMVDVRGRILDRKSMGEDLFWAITGGGGSSFGVVLAYKIRLVSVPPKVTVFLVEKTTIIDHEHNAANVINLVRNWQLVSHNLHQDIFIRMILDVVNGTKNRASFHALFFGDSKRLMTLMKTNFPELGLQQKDCIEMKWSESVLYWAGFPVKTTPVSALLSRIPLTLLELGTPVMEFSPYGGKMDEIPASAKPFPHRAGNIAKIQYMTYWNENGGEAADHYMKLTRKLHEFMTPFVSKFPREAFFNYRDFDIGITSNIGKNSYKEGMVYGVKYFGQNFNKLVLIKTKVDPENYFKNEQSIPTLPQP